MKNEQKKYALRYDLKFENKEGGYLEEEARADSMGLCDAFLLLSIIRDNGNTSFLYTTKDGETSLGKIPNTELFDLMFFLALEIKEAKDINPDLIGIVEKMTTDIRKYMQIKYEHSDKY